MPTIDSTNDCYRFVDMWAVPGVHPSNTNLLRDLKSADTSHFNTHMEIVGTVSEMDEEAHRWDKTHIIGMRTDIWRSNKTEMEEQLETLQRKRKSQLKKSIKSDGRLNEAQTARLESLLAGDGIMTMKAGDVQNQRLVLKLFKTTGARVRWCGTIEEVTTTEVTQSMGSRRNLVSFVVILPQMEYVTYVQQTHRTFRIPSVFTFGFFEDQQMWNLTVKRKWISLGADYEIEVDGQQVGTIDGKLVSLGCDSYFDIQDHPLALSTPFVDLMTLFTASIGYHKKMRSRIERRVAAVNRGDSHCHVISNEELCLQHNGRAAA